MSEDFIVRFWGVRGSYPVPGQHTVRFGGNTPCVEIQAGMHTIIMDAGTGIINLGSDLMRRARAQGDSPIVATIFFSHMHHDHTQGFPFFEPAYHGDSVLHMLGPKIFTNDLQDILADAMLPPHFPISLDELASFKRVWNLAESEVVLLGDTATDLRIVNAHRDDSAPAPDAVRISVYHSYAHPKNGVHIYSVEWRGKTVVYATDTEGYIEVDQRLVAFAQDADLLIHDAQYLQKDYVNSSKPRQGWGHSTIAMACAVAQQSNASQLVLFHHDPTHDDATIACMEHDAQQLFSNTCAAYEGLELSL